LHKSVFLKEAIERLAPVPGDTILDATVGAGGHARGILEKITPGGMLLGIDQDREALRVAEHELKNFPAASYKLFQGNFRNIDTIIHSAGINKINGALFDLGVSSFHFDDPARGFSINNDGPLDMRMDPVSQVTAFRVVNRYSSERLIQILTTYGEERYAKRITSYIVHSRAKAPIETTHQLAAIIKKAVGFKYRRLRIHPATRTFQAIRIEVNDELDAIKEALNKLPDILEHGARICVISFHSLEDRIVKHYFREAKQKGIFVLINKKPFIPGEAEIGDNPRSRSAKMRVAEFIG